MSSHYFTNGSQFCIPSKENYEKLQTTGFFKIPFEEIRKKYKEDCQNTYNPQMTKGKAYKGHFAPNAEVHGNSTHYVKDNNGTRYPTSILKFNRARGLHPTQKPVNLLEYLIKTYTNEGETVLDLTAGSMSTVIASLNTKRNCIAIEKDGNYFDIGCKRVHKHILDNNINLWYNQVCGGVVLWQNSKTEQAKDTEGF
jgi:site-specific DNA-methyltransferase (adenine-specific)